MFFFTENRSSPYSLSSINWEAFPIKAYKFPPLFGDWVTPPSVVFEHVMHVVELFLRSF